MVLSYKGLRSVQASIALLSGDVDNLHCTNQAQVGVCEHNLRLWPALP